MDAKEIDRLLRSQLEEQGATVCVEIALPNRLRFDVLALMPDQSLLGIEVKVSTSDLGRDTKWMRYLQYCDTFFFCVGPLVNQSKVPPGTGLIVTSQLGLKTIRGSAPSIAVPRLRQSAIDAIRKRIASEDATKTPHLAPSP